MLAMKAEILENMPIFLIECNFEFIPHRISKLVIYRGTIKQNTFVL